MSRIYPRMVRVVLILLSAFCAVALAQTPRRAGAAPSDRPVVNFKVEMSDGVRLNTDVYYPAQGSGPWPVLLYRTPYNIATDNIGLAAEWGFACVCQDTRGRHGSEGVDRMFLDDGWGPDHQDGRETVDWILAQSWCNQRIATYGSSARGITQNMLAGALADSVRCMSVYIAPAGFYDHLVFPGGAFRQYDVEGWLSNQGSSYMVDSIYAHPNDDEWWSWFDTETRHALETIPTFQYGGWFDMFSEGTIASFTGLQYGGGPGAAGNQKLLMGPWTHSMDPSHAGELTFPDAQLETGEALIGSVGDWLGYWIWDQATGVMEKPPVAYYLMGDTDDGTAPGNEWRTSPVWPPPSVPVAWYLRSGSRLSLTAPSLAEPAQVYAYDPLDPVPTRGGGNLILPAGPHDQRPVLNRPDVLVFQTDALTSPVEVVGPVRVNLFVSSDRLDTDFTAKLCDVYPDGRAMLICDGILRARHRLRMDGEDFLTPGEVVPVTIDLWETAIVFNTGHKILVAVSSSNAPRFDPNPNTGEPFMQHTTTLVAHNAVYHEPGLPSHLLLPVTGALPGGMTDDAPPPLTSRGALRLIGRSPFVDRTVWRLSLDSPGLVDLVVLDCTGRRVRRLSSGFFPRSEQEIVWDGLDETGRPAPAGVFRCVLRHSGRSESSTVIRIR